MAPSTTIRIWLIVAALVGGAAAEAKQKPKAKKPAAAAKKAGAKGPPSLALESVDRETGRVEVLVGGLGRAPAARLFVFHDDRERKFIATGARCAPSPADGGRLRCTLELPRPYAAATVTALTLQLGSREVAAPPDDVIAKFAAAPLPSSIGHSPSTHAPAPVPVPVPAPVPDGGTGAAILDPSLAWYGDNRARLEAMIRAHGRGSPGYDAAHPPVATFDWDNTVVRNDVGDATLYWMLRNDKVRQPPGGDWKQTSRWLTDGAAAALAAACGKLAAPGAPLPTGREAGCATEIVTIAGEGHTTRGEPAFRGFDHRRLEPRYAWAAALQAGWTPDEVRGFAEQVMAEDLARPVGATQTVGKVTGLAGYLRYYDQIRNLIDALQKNGFDVWIISASSQVIAEPFAAKVGVPAKHVVGIRAIVDGNGKLGYHLRGCGPVKDGEDALVTYIDGKRCWINKAIFGDESAKAMDLATRRQVFAAGDSDTDVTFLRDATALRLVINRNRPELMCHAYADRDGNWLVNPMFIEPLPRRADAYPCATTACADAAGTPAPCHDDAGAVLPDQLDRVHP